MGVGHNRGGFPGGSVAKNLPANKNTGDVSWIPGSGRSPGGGNGNPLQYPYLESPMDRRAWRAIVHGVAKRARRHTHQRCLQSQGLDSLRPSQRNRSSGKW